MVNPPEAVVPGAKLCCACFIKLRRSDPSTETLAGTDTTNVEELDDGAECISSPESDTSFVDVDAALASLDAKAGKLAACSRKPRGKQELESASMELKRKLELAYNVSLENSESQAETKCMVWWCRHWRRNSGTPLLILNLFNSKVNAEVQGF